MSDQTPPAIRITGPATPEDVAAVIAVLSATGPSSGTRSDEPATSLWADPRTTLRRPPVERFPGAWRFSLRR
jgi:hypothetical protein